jgi:hypothetical protein
MKLRSIAMGLGAALVLIGAGISTRALLFADSEENVAGLVPDSVDTGTRTGRSSAAQRGSKGALRGATGAPSEATPSDEAARLFPGTPAGLLLREHWRREQEVTSRSEAAERHARSMEALRPHARDAALLLYDAYRALDGVDQLGQYTAVSTLAALESEHAAAPLEDIARAPIEVEEEAGDHHGGAKAHERVVRLAAITGLGRLSSSGSAAALDALLGIVRDPTLSAHRSIKVRAIRSYVGTGPGAEQRAAHIQGDVPEELRWALEPREEPTPQAVAAVLDSHRGNLPNTP